jgi:hypothetical protein
MLSGKVFKFSITFVICISTGSAPNSVSSVLQDRRLSESESVFKVFFSTCALSSNNHNFFSVYQI